MMVSPAQVQEIVLWATRHRQMLQEKYSLQFVAYSATRLLASGIDFHQVQAKAEQIGEPFLIEWIADSTADIEFYG
jgi:hypothetical protein